MVKVIRDPGAFPSEMKGCALSIGKFDGVHCGHASILQRLRISAAVRSVPSVVFTFDPSPGEVIRPHLSAPLLCTTAYKSELISLYKPDILLIYPTTREFLQLTAYDFFENIVRNLLDVRVLVEGTNFTFGANRQGNTTMLQELCRENGIGLQMVPSVISLGREISSSRIRSLVREGQMEAARGMLNRPYRISGYVVHGEHRGRRLGYPTANLNGVTTLLPKPGLYAAEVMIDHTKYTAAVNLGGNPTFGVETTKIEVYIMNFNGDLYGRVLDVDFIARIRDVIRFESKESLLSQMKKDLDKIRKVCFWDHRDLNG